ncbi:hypothetical protein SPRG_10529 [Saprolegnia parasitica CBS 223.65]|uniref:RRM domain-containing protein n=1 Tax=Saprolegnia parasitica (strain CBS 223.65) TaxID=695850 RepID=A0A067CAC5_SAPPC|nr:hypothetical protein SPRG_10529 [Saprolegnia parasitica CBS 223.65]KDO23752.1 hypothetical protein SPRG_10529 [Saprolegnia parasitica CBS 223.65]|eukprot:XP_012205568.1 hypothetical protein SPRG_10529 [Saprolegnia parasitica CBS 223.65]
MAEVPRFDGPVLVDRAGFSAWQAEFMTSATALGYATYYMEATFDDPAAFAAAIAQLEARDSVVEPVDADAAQRYAQFKALHVFYQEQLHARARVYLASAVDPSLQRTMATLTSCYDAYQHLLQRFSPSSAAAILASLAAAAGDEPATVVRLVDELLPALRLAIVGDKDLCGLSVIDYDTHVWKELRAALMAQCFVDAPRCQAALAGESPAPASSAPSSTGTEASRALGAAHEPGSDKAPSDAEPGPKRPRLHDILSAAVSSDDEDGDDEALPRDEPPLARTVYLTQLNHNVTEAVLQELCESFGLETDPATHFPVIDVYLNYRTRRPRGDGILRFTTAQGAVDAVDALHNKQARPHLPVLHARLLDAATSALLTAQMYMPRTLWTCATCRREISCWRSACDECKQPRIRPTARSELFPTDWLCPLYNSSTRLHLTMRV